MKTERGDCNYLGAEALGQVNLRYLAQFTLTVPKQWRIEMLT
ncbi:MAG TPA: hypothetical protein VHO84_02865 [Syntrophorhabdaceae bacterium]|nr:hypothetical protein [Syntrophorhabdaceae bacterium]